MVKDGQVRALRVWVKEREASLAVAAMKTGMDRKTARKYRHGKLPSERVKEHDWRTRPDVFADVWAEVEVRLELAPGLETKTLFEDLQRRFPGRFQDGQLRTLQRRVKRWRALQGPDREVYFAQQHQPGQLGASDFTHLTSLNVTIAGVPFAHLVYHFVLTYSNWEYVKVCFSESFESFSAGFQEALWELGAVPELHRTDRMSLAVNQDGHPALFTQRYQAMLSHYGMRGQAINAGQGHENGDAEQSHNQFKRKLEQALLLRGSRDFATREEYEEFLRALCRQLNAGRQQRLTEERARLKPLPACRLESFKRLEVRVSPGSTIAVERNLYWRRACRCGTHNNWCWPCPGCGVNTSITSTIGTSSTGWCVSREHLPSIAIRLTCSRPAASAWLTTPCAPSNLKTPAANTCTSYSWRPRRAKPVSTKPYDNCCRVRRQ